MPGIYVFVILLVVMIGFTLVTKKLTIAGTINGGIISIAIFIGTGFPGVILLACFFIAATLATSWRSDLKINAGISEKGHGTRNSFQVLANGGLAGLFGFVAILYPQYRDLMLILIASSISAASADTISSELGSLYGRRFFNIMTFRPDRRGENGVVSLEGFAFGLLGSCLVAITYGLTEKFNLSTLLIIVVAGSIGNLVDSVLGATLERKGQLKNDSVNFLNTVGAAVVAFMVMQF